MKPVICPEETANALLASKPAAAFLPNITTISACPLLANTELGPAVLGPGWHPLRDGTFITAARMPETVSLQLAIEMLEAIICDFDFASPGDRSRGLASFITPALAFGGWLRDPIPIDIGEADASQSGKTYRQKLVASVYREVPNLVVQRSNGVGGLDESISQKLIDGNPFVLIDNARGKIDSPYLEAIITSPSAAPARVPHRGEVKVDPRGFVFQITSNGAETTRDLANRASIVRIRKRPDGYAFKHYRNGGDVYSEIRAAQPYYLGAVFSVIREWVAQGQPRTSEHRHSFREWAQVLDWIVQNIFKAAPLMDNYEEARRRVSDPRQGWLRSLCIALRDAKLVGDHTASELAEFSLENDLVPPNARGDADEATVGRCIGRIMKAAFGALNPIEIDGFKIQRIMRYSKTAQKDVPVYRFL